MMSQPLVSIVIPCFNAESYIAEAIQSALEQTYTNCEIVVVDDGSTDRSLDVVKGFGNRLRWFTGPNRGGCAARNQGVAEARGEWIQFLDADDWLVPDTVERKLKLSLNETQVKVIWCSAVARKEKDRGIVKFNYPEKVGILEMIRNGMSVQTSSPLHRKLDLLELGGFDESLPCAQEYDLHIRLAKSGFVFFVDPDIGGIIRIVKGSVSRESIPRMQMTRVEVIRKYFMSEKRPLEPGYRDALGVRFGREYVAAMRGGALNRADEYFNLAVGFGCQWNREVYRRVLDSVLVAVVGPRFFESTRNEIRRLAAICALRSKLP